MIFLALGADLCCEIVLFFLIIIQQMLLSYRYYLHYTEFEEFIIDRKQRNINVYNVQENLKWVTIVWKASNFILCISLDVTALMQHPLLSWCDFSLPLGFFPCTLKYVECNYLCIIAIEQHSRCGTAFISWVVLVPINYSQSLQCTLNAKFGLMKF